jgi:hypothetical protein
VEFFASTVVLVLLAPAFAVVSLRYKVLPFLRKTYFFWCIVSLFNFSFLAFLAFPPLLLMIPKSIAKFWNFLLPPLVVAGAVGLVVLGLWFLLIRRMKKPLVESAGPYVVNAVFLAALVTAAEAHKSQLIEQALVGHTPECVYVRSFWDSVNVAGDRFYAHAMYVENGRNFYWSYSNLAFFEGHDRLDRNFPCPER